MNATELSRLINDNSFSARAATSEDPADAVLQIGRDFFMLRIDESGVLTTTVEVGPGTPTRIVPESPDSTVMGPAKGWQVGIARCGKFVKLRF